MNERPREGKTPRTPRFLSEVYAMLMKDPLLFARSKKNIELAQVLGVFLFVAASVVFLRWICLRYLDPDNEVGAIWWFLTGSAAVSIIAVMVFSLVAVYEVLKAFSAAVDGLQEQATKAYARRADLRARTLDFAEKMSLQYGWILTINKDHQRLRALQEWYDEMVKNWRIEHDEFAKLRATDDRDIVIEELDRAHKDIGSNLLKLIDERKDLYHYTVRYANDYDRKKEILKLQERINLEKFDFDDRQTERQEERAGGKVVVRPDESPDDSL